MALTRAKYLLIVVGNGDTLMGGETWSKFLNWNIKNSSYFEVDKEADVGNRIEGIFKGESSVRHEKPF